MFKKIAIILFFAVGMTACNSAPTRTEAEAMLRKELGDDHLWALEKGVGTNEADFALDYVSGISYPDANTMQVEFMFHWTLTGPTAKKLAALGDKQPVNCQLSVLGRAAWKVDRWCVSPADKALGTAIFVKYDDGWRLKRVLA